ncbi:hypothetical protein [Microcoleus sp. B4-C1]|uniref:hypothetical protein n=1 Tax=Microcoleus sp. B4-C1 TaxID=2818660 RepID=UPI002FD1F4C4
MSDRLYTPQLTQRHYHKQFQEFQEFWDFQSDRFQVRCPNAAIVYATFVNSG